MTPHPFVVANDAWPIARIVDRQAPDQIGPASGAATHGIELDSNFAESSGALPEGIEVFQTERTLRENTSARQRDDQSVANGAADTDPVAPNTSLASLEHISFQYLSSGSLFATEENFVWDADTNFPLLLSDFDSSTDASETGTLDSDLMTGTCDVDYLSGLAGNDTLSAGRGNDTIQGDDGNDLLRGGRGSDVLLGSDGNDSLRGQRGGDMLFGQAGDDNVKGGGGNDTLEGGAGDDVLRGGTRKDNLFGGTGNDTLFGNAFDDVLAGGYGSDYLNGGGEDDRLSGNWGNDTLRGRDGADTFVFRPKGGADVIEDFDVSENRLLLRSFGLTAQEVEDLARFENGALVIHFSADEQITFLGLSTSEGLAETIEFL